MGRELTRKDEQISHLQGQINALIAQMKMGPQDPLHPPMIEGSDPSMDRINATHATATAPELAKFKKNK